MAVDKVKPLKIETPLYGTQDDMGDPTEVNTSEDYLAAKGMAFENSDGHLIDRSVGGEIQFTDPVNGTVTVGQLAAPPSYITTWFVTVPSTVPTGENYLTSCVDVTDTLTVNGTLTAAG